MKMSLYKKTFLNLRFKILTYIYIYIYIYIYSKILKYEPINHNCVCI